MTRFQLAARRWRAGADQRVTGCASAATPDSGPETPPTLGDQRVGEPDPDLRSTARIDVGGHRLYLTCEGTGAPTVIYLHGAITEPTVVPHQNARAISGPCPSHTGSAATTGAIVGDSDTVDAVQRPA